MSTKQIIYRSIVLVGLCFSLLQVLYASTGLNAVGHSFLTRYKFSIFLPEGWAFFTRSPRDEKHVLYQEINGKWVNITHKNSSLNNWGGLSRKSRRFNLEMAKLRNAIPPKSLWQSSLSGQEEVGVLAQTCNRTLVAFTPADYAVLTPGVYAIKRYRIPPWAWASSPTHYTPKYSIAIVVLK